MSIRYFMTSIKTGAKVVLAMLLTGVSVQSAWATVLQDVHFSALPGQRFEVRLDFDQQPDTPKGYVIDQPARIVLDFPGVDNSLTTKKFPLSFGNAQSAVVLSAGGRTRLILNMVELSNYQTRVDGSSLIVEVGEKQVVSEAYAARSTKTLASTSGFSGTKAKADITNVDFRRGKDGEGKIIIDLSDPHVSIDVEERDGKINVSFLDTMLPQELRRRLDVTDFATPVSYVDVKYDGRDTLVTVDPEGVYDYLAYQADNEYVISVKPLTEQEQEELKSKFAYVGDKLSLNFQDIDVRAVLQLIADFTELNLVASDTVEGKITLRLDNVPWDQALAIVLKTKGLDSRQIGNVLMVAPAAEIAERERQELETQRQLQELAPLRTEFVQVLYADAEELFKLFKVKEGQNTNNSGNNNGPATASILSERGSAIVDKRTNSIILTDTEEKISAFRKLIKQIDIPIRQVMIEARIVTANSDFAKELGVKWGAEGFEVSDSGQNAFGFGGSRNINVGDGMVFGDFIDFDGDGQLEEILLNDTTAVDLGVLNPAGSFAFSVLSDNFFVDMELSALEDSGYAEIVSQPKVITGDKQVAFIQSGKEIPYQEASASGATTTAFKEAVLKLEVTPQITPDNRIIMSLKINQDSVGDVDTASDIPIIDVTQLETKVLVGNGETIVLGGIFQNQTVNGETKVPLLGDIPVLGRLFKKTSQSEQKRELIIFITPRILAPTMTN